MTKTNHELTTEQLALLEFCIDPQSIESIKNFFNNEETASQHIKILKRQRLIEAVKGPTYNYLQISRKGKGLLQL